jgi:hypothetical protein
MSHKYRLVCALGHQGLVTVLTRCGLALPAYFLADEKHSHCLTGKVYLPTIVRGRVIWHLGYTLFGRQQPIVGFWATVGKRLSLPKVSG